MKYVPYESRLDAGKILANYILKSDQELDHAIKNNKNQHFTFAIPNGGVPVAEGFCSELQYRYSLIIVRKIKIPYNTEAGFGSVTTDGTVLINESLLDGLNLSSQAIEKSILTTKKEIEERLIFYNITETFENKFREEIRNKNIFMIDDGLASGFTMLAAIKMIKKYEPKQIFVAVPTAPMRTVKKIEKHADEIFCPNIRNVWRFAVAEAYKNWYDLPESEVLEIIQKSSYFVE
ncbi:MAG: hypothetical protein GF383_13000 [Candidatus Lokiarchaeota archaeon]|nr:hypothetical protein [Candidatus Lokiarchaeota archaeon]MBD3342025.1 hypothetical protein [Candidatus Lokiarchaeota archaeon]